MDRDERLAAYVDGELSAAERAAFERDLERDPQLQQAVGRQQALRARLAAAFDPVLQEPVPLELRLAAQAANTPRGSWRPPAWAAMAACLALGVLAGRTLLPQGGLIVPKDGALEARGGLAAALDQRLASDPGAIRLGISFKTAQGRYCRTFESTEEKLAGLACRDADRWTVRTLAAWAPPSGQGYRTAGSDTPAPVLAAVDEMISGEPLDAAAEQAARDRRWKP